MSSTTPSSDSPDDSGDSPPAEDNNNNSYNNPPSPPKSSNSSNSLLSASLVTKTPSPPSPPEDVESSSSPPPTNNTQSTPSPSPPTTTNNSQPTPSPPPDDNKTPPPASPPPKSSPPPNSPPPPTDTSPPLSPSPPPTSPSPEPPDSQNVFSPPPPSPPQDSPSPTPPSPTTPENSPPSPSPPFEPPSDSGGNPVPPSSPTPSPPAPTTPPSMSPPVTSSPPSPPSIVPPSPAVAPPAHPSANNSGSSQPQFSQSKNEEGGLSTGTTIITTVVVVSVFLGILGTVAFCVWNRRKRETRQNVVYVIPSPSQESGNNSDLTLLKAQNSTSRSAIAYSPAGAGSFSNSRSWFTYEELVEATNGFSSENLLGQGGFGFVYKGKLQDGRDVAVKQLKIGGGQGDREFRSEVEIISRIHHRHLVSLVGFCILEDRRLLIYDYLPNNNLYFHLHGESRLVMDWSRRVKIAVGAARGIAYLHEDCHPRIIHRDIKSSNILLDENFEARVSDFGLAKLAMDTNTHVTTRVMGTFGYMAPEYASCGKLTEKSDVFSYGVVLLELITGRKPLDSSQDESLVEWARPLLTKSLETQNFESLADPRLEKNYVDNEMSQMVEAAAACVRHSSAKRPKMGQVVRALDSISAQDLDNGMKVGESELFNESAQINFFRKMAFGTQDYSIVDSSWSSEASDVNMVNSPRE